MRHGIGMCLLAVISVLVCAPNGSAHMAFKKELQRKYPGMKVSCNACHVKKKPKTERSEFGKLFHKELQKTHVDLTKDWKSKKGTDKKDYEKKTMVPAFQAALKIVKAMKNDKGEVYDDLIKNAKIAEIKKDPKYKPEEADDSAANSTDAKEDSKNESEADGKKDAGGESGDKKEESAEESKGGESGKKSG